MFDSALSILDNYVDTSQVSRFRFYSVEMERGENPEDLYYLCTLRDRYYVVFETDYVADPLSSIAKEATEIFEGFDLAPLHWITKKSAQTTENGSTVPINADDLEKHKKALFTDRSGSPYTYALRHAVIEFTDTSKHQRRRFDPTAYGSVIS